MTIRTSWMKNTVLLLSMTLTGGVLMAQEATTPAPETATQSAANTGVQLSATQKQQLREMRLSARDQAAVIRNDQTLTPAQKQQKLQELRANIREQMKSVLTPAQQQAFAQRRANAQARRASRLGLTADQQSKLKELRQSNRQQRQAVLANTSLTNDQKLAQLAQIRQASQAQLATILSPDQLQKMQQMRKMHRRRAM